MLGRQAFPSAVRQELLSAPMLLPLCRADLRVPVDPMVMASDASSTGGASHPQICGLTARGLGASKVAQTQQTSLCDDEVVLICINDSLGAGRRTMELLQLGVAAFVWIGADRHAERICRQAWANVMVLSRDEKSLATAVLSVRSSHPIVEWVVMFAGRSMSGKGSLETCEEDCWHEDNLAAVVRICLVQLRHKWL